MRRSEALDYTRKNRTEVLPVMAKFTEITDPAQLNEALDVYPVPAPTDGIETGTSGSKVVC